MTISSISSTNSLLKQLEANGLSADKAKLVEGDLAAATKAVSVGVGTAATSTESVRGALDSRIAADVSSGKLSQGDAADVKKTLDDIDAQSTGSGITSQAAPAASTSSQTSGGNDAGSGGGGGGGGGGSSKTELSETVTISGSTKTTVITYTDNTTETTTTTATDADEARYGTSSSTSSTGDGTAVANDYLSTIERGSLVDQTA